MQHRIKQALPAPTQCDNCCSLNVVYAENKIIYGRNCGPWPMCYFCEDCRASVGCHADTNIPLGLMADAATKRWRKKAHDSFDLLWRSGLMTRTKAYNWLSQQLRIDPNHCHISWLTRAQLEVAVELSKVQLQNPAMLRRRRMKDDARKAKRDTRDFNEARRHKRNR